MNVTRVTGDSSVVSGLKTPRKLHTVSIAPTTATPTAGLLTIYDSAAESGTAVYSEWVFATTPGHTVTLDCEMYNGIYVGYDGTLANVSCTVTWQ